MAKAIFLLLSMCIVLAACSPKPEAVSSENPGEAAVQDGAAATGNVVSEEYVEVTVRNSSEPVKKSPFDVIAQAQAAKDSGKNVDIQIS